ncbi:hypothetical protein M501DRAFT_1034881 [Patellaria atrata CBS 101060]|uniref:Tho complex subunit 7 n=1 Tax=Patellaria atrata CBS 101060 TaxID=1346257 RepID=A0A9P4S4W3_9PEZI|nr:hypothetical protein M501DRAFT_1034881 [Patellaria atrata CBS 101060]
MDKAFRQAQHIQIDHMASNEYGLIEQSDEDALHKSRLLSVEQKPFARVTKRLLGEGSLISQPPTSLPTPPPDASAADEEAAARESERQKQAEKRKQWREDVILDFAALEASIVRIQFLQNSNEKERERYAAEKIKILETAQAIRDNTAELRIQLEEAQKMLALRKTYDELAEKITSNRMLRPREDQHAQLEKLNAEIAELEQESLDYKHTWAERREQFERIVGEGKQMLRLIRDEKEEAERKEGMEGADDGDDGEGSTMRGEPSLGGTPRPDGESTPMHIGHEGDTQLRLGVQHGDRLAPISASPSRSHSRAGSPGLQGRKDHDVEMTESNGNTQREPEDDLSEIEEGEMGEDSPIVDKMDET